MVIDFKISISFYRKLFFLGYPLLFVFLLSGCSSNDDTNENGNDNSDDTVNEVVVDLEEISGEYSGLASNATVSDDISMRIIPRSSEGQYTIEFYGFSDLTPCCNSNGRPDGTGSLSMENNQLTMNINWSSDSPECSGTYTGSSGTFGMGRVIIEMVVDLNCLPSEDIQTINVMKIADL